MILLTALAAGGVATGGNPFANQARDRGRTPIQGMTMPRGQRQHAIDEITRRFSGTLIDAGCRDRSLMNLQFAPTPLVQAQGSGGGAAVSGGISAFGVTVSPQTLQGERADVMLHQVPDIRTRQTDPSCAVTGSTTEFSLLLDNGRLLNLDPGGTTLAWQGVLSTTEGREMLNGFAPGLKPNATMLGYIQGSTLVVQSPIDVEPQAGSRGSATRMNSQ